MSLRLALVGVASLGVVAASAVAYACSAPALEEAVPDTSSADRIAPAVIEAVDVSIRRGHAPDCRFGKCSTDSCDDSGGITLTFAAPTDDQTPEDGMAYRLQVVDGEAPEGLIPAFAFHTFDPPGEISLQWSDGASDDQEPLDFSVVLRAVDQAGNEGAPSEPIDIVHAGSSAGCSVGSRGGMLPVALLLPLLGGWARRRRV